MIEVDPEAIIPIFVEASVKAELRFIMFVGWNVKLIESFLIRKTVKIKWLIEC